MRTVTKTVNTQPFGNYFRKSTMRMQRRYSAKAKNSTHFQCNAFCYLLKPHHPVETGWHVKISRTSKHGCEKKQLCLYYVTWARPMVNVTNAARLRAPPNPKAVDWPAPCLPPEKGRRMKPFCWQYLGAPKTEPVSLQKKSLPNQPANGKPAIRALTVPSVCVVLRGSPTTCTPEI